ncbi:hypothetical protein [Sphingomonas flavescens]|uniref:hypothetical protein n=1 Tax=Sphingomonas flavescens TaxID=3132797 RepID=UPI002804BB84|nr:hypothetical protein [Sphingomonas limnosediminicola]
MRLIVGEAEGFELPAELATETLEEGLETCHKIVADYRSALLGVQDRALEPQDSEHPQPTPA